MVVWELHYTMHFATVYSPKHTIELQSKNHPFRSFRIQTLHSCFSCTCEDENAPNHLSKFHPCPQPLLCMAVWVIHFGLGQFMFSLRNNFVFNIYNSASYLAHVIYMTTLDK